MPRPATHLPHQTRSAARRRPPSAMQGSEPGGCGWGSCACARGVRGRGECACRWCGVQGVRGGCCTTGGRGRVRQPVPFPRQQLRPSFSPPPCLIPTSCGGPGGPSPSAPSPCCCWRRCVGAAALRPAPSPLTSSEYVTNSTPSKRRRPLGTESVPCVWGGVGWNRGARGGVPVQSVSPVPGEGRAVQAGCELD